MIQFDSKKAISKDIDLKMLEIKWDHCLSFLTNMFMFLSCLVPCVWHPALITKSLGKVIDENCRPHFKKDQV